MTNKNKIKQEVTKADYFNKVLDTIKFFYGKNLNVQVKIPLLRQNGRDNRIRGNSCKAGAVG